MPTWALMRLHAERVAPDLMRAGARRDRSPWTVEIGDASGRHVLSTPFTDALVNRPARQD